VPSIFDPLGEVRSREGQRTRDSRAKFSNGLAHTPRLVPAFHNPPAFHLIAN
jgi:hypothetical protein